MTKPTFIEHLEGADAPSRQSARIDAVPQGPVEGAVTSHANAPVVSGRRGPTAAVDAFDVLEALTGSIEAPADWAAEHDHYLYGTPKRGAPRE
jgi:hypothetical protein